MMRKFKTGQRVWWNDPAGETSCEYEVLDPREDYNADRAEDGTSDDRVILVGDEHGEAEVYTCELEMLCPLTHEEFERMEWQVGRHRALGEALLGRMTEIVGMCDDARISIPNNSYGICDEEGEYGYLYELCVEGERLVACLEYDDGRMCRILASRLQDKIALFEILWMMLRDNTRE